MRRFALTLVLVLTFGGISGTPAPAGEITVLSAGAMRSVLQELAASFERASGDHLTFTYGTAGEVAQRLASHDVFDVAVATKPRLQTLEAAGTIVADSIVVIGRSPIALAVRQGAAKPDISSVEAFKRALLTASSIAYTDPASGGTSGIHMAQVMHDLGIFDEIKSKIKSVTGQPGAPPSVGGAVARGEAEIGLQPISELSNIAGIEIVGLIPEQLQTPDLTYAAGLPTVGGDRQASNAFLRFLVGQEGEAVVKSKGLIPGEGG